MNQKSKRTSQSNRLLPIFINGVLAKIDPSNVDKDDPSRIIHHGEFEGIKVNSGATLNVGDSVIIYADANNQHAAISMTQPTFGLTAKQWLERRGYTVTKKPAT